VIRPCRVASHHSFVALRCVESSPNGQNGSVNAATITYDQHHRTSLLLCLPACCPCWVPSLSLRVDRSGWLDPDRCAFCMHRFWKLSIVHQSHILHVVLLYSSITTQNLPMIGRDFSLARLHCYLFFAFQTFTTPLYLSILLVLNSLAYFLARGA